MDERELDEEYGSYICESLIDNADKGSVSWVDDGNNFLLDFYYDHHGGLEGWYVDEYSGTLYVNNTAFYIKMIDMFCAETELTIERDPEDDLKEGDEGYTVLEKQINLNNKKETIMSNNMNVVTVILMDQDDKLKGTNLNIIGKFEDVVIPTGQDEMTTLLKLSLNGDVKKMLDEHNEKRTQVVNNQTLERTGKKVNLQPIVIEDVQILIK